MALVLEISPEAEARIRRNATVRGQDVTEYILAFTENDQVIDLTEFEDQADFDASVEGIREGLANLEAGRTYPLEETIGRLDPRREQTPTYWLPQTISQRLQASRLHVTG